MKPRVGVPVFVALLLVLSWLGTVDQARIERQSDLLERKGELLRETAALRADAAEIRGPLAVGAWARRHGMVPAPSAPVLAAVPARPAPPPEPVPTGLEVTTRWR